MSKKIDTGVIAFDNPDTQEAFDIAKEIAVALNKSRDRIADVIKTRPGYITSDGEGALRLEEVKLSYELLRDGYGLAIEHFKAVAPKTASRDTNDCLFPALTLLTKLALGRE